MVAIKDMALPTCCINCGLLGKEKIYCSIYPRKDLDIITVATNRPNWCPLLEIEERKVGKILINDKYRVPMYECLGCNHPVMKYWKYCPHCSNNIEERKNE